MVDSPVVESVVLLPSEEVPEVELVSFAVACDVLRGASAVAIAPAAPVFELMLVTLIVCSPPSSLFVS
jgi:hypothetical protein